MCVCVCVCVCDFPPLCRQAVIAFSVRTTQKSACLACVMDLSVCSAVPSISHRHPYPHNDKYQVCPACVLNLAPCFACPLETSLRAATATEMSVHPACVMTMPSVVCTDVTVIARPMGGVTGSHLSFHRAHVLESSGRKIELSVK